MPEKSIRSLLETSSLKEAHLEYLFPRAGE